MTRKFGFATVVMATIATNSIAAHPQVLIGDDGREALTNKLQTADWAKAGYAKLRARLDPIVAKSQADPEFAASRLFMNWDTHYITPLVAKSVTVGGEGRAPIPTPRFAGARNWATDYSRPAKFEDWIPYNDKGGKVHLRNGKTGQMEWVDPGITGRNFETGNEFVMSLAADAAFVYWLTGDEKYAAFSEHILTTYMNGFALMQPPKPVPNTADMMNIIGPTSFEVIHEQLATQVALAYDFLQPYLKAKHIETMPIQLGLKRWAQRITDGGGRDGNWNLNQAVMITYAGLALEDDSTYADKRGRQYYVNIVLNADLPHQNGLTHVIKQGLDPKSKLWPEAAGYGFGSAAQLIELSSLLSADPDGAKVLADPILPESVMAQRQMIYPNGLSNGVGDTTNTRLNSGALELLIAHARKAGDPALEEKLTQLLDREIDSGNYSRDSRSDLFALTRYVDSLKPVSAAAAGPDRSFWFDGLNIMMQHNVVPGDADHSLAAAFYGTNGGHVHINGMAIELYGAGYILGADPGRGASYWTADHRGYYVTPVAHNTVIVNGASTYAEYKSPDKKMTVQAAEPAPGATALSPNIGFTRGAFHYAQPAADQQRTLALIRTGPKSGFYYDVFRSRTAKSSADTFQDYFYHNMGQSLSLGDAKGGTLTLKSSDILATQPNLQKGYSYLTNERSAPLTGDLRAQFDMKLPDGKTAKMAVWMPASPGRTVFAVDAPKNNAIREGIASPLRDIPMPTLLIRQTGQAWNTPFVAIYEPFTGEDGPAVQSVRAAAAEADGFVATVVEGNAPRLLLMQDAGERNRTLVSITFRGTFAAVFGTPGNETECYLGDGITLACGDLSLKSTTDAAIAADARREGDAWIVGSTGPVRVTLPFQGKGQRSLRIDGKPASNAEWKMAGEAAIASITLPSGVNRRIEMGDSK